MGSIEDKVDDGMRIVRPTSGISSGRRGQTGECQKATKPDVNCHGFISDNTMIEPELSDLRSQFEELEMKIVYWKKRTDSFEYSRGTQNCPRESGKEIRRWKAGNNGRSTRITSRRTGTPKILELRNRC